MMSLSSMSVAGVMRMKVLYMMVASWPFLHVDTWYYGISTHMLPSLSVAYVPEHS